MKFQDLLQSSAEFENIIEEAKKGKFPIHVTGPSESVKAHFVMSLLAKLQRKGFIITYSEMQAKKLCDDICFFDKDAAVVIPETDLLLYKAEAADNAAENKRMEALLTISQKKVVILSVMSLLQYAVSRKDLELLSFEAGVGDVFSMEELIDRFINMGYTRLDVVESPGQFAVRGGIIDIFSPGGDAFRIEFFGDEIDLIKVFDPLTQLSTDKRDKVKISPASSRSFKGSMLSYIDKEDIVVFDEPVRISETAETIRFELEDNIKTLIEKEVEFDSEKEYLQSYSKIITKLTANPILSMASLSRVCPDFRTKTNLNLTARTLQNYGGNIDFLYDDITAWERAKYNIFILGGSSQRAKKLCEALHEKGFKATYYSSLEEIDNTNGTISVIKGSVNKGFEYSLINTVIVSDKEIFASEKKKRKVKKDPNSAKIKNPFDITAGDLVVHNVHGIGKYLGMKRLEVDGVTRDYFKIEYRGNDFLYIPVDQLDLINKYIGAGEGKNVRINKLGGAEWAATKAKVKANVAQMAKKLIALYAARSVAEGVAFEKDSAWQRDFEADFIYEETEDQLRAVEEIKKDMESPRPMDRLLCGDVGYGKTEVAMRAAFKAVDSGYQVAYLVPTTILAQQQYNNFVQRMKKFPITVRMLSRFSTKKETDETLRMLKSGECDIVIGTHKLLSDKIEYKRLGLLVIDEEQRFGVGHKEKIKEFKKNVDVLTLSATPIPRTLHMAMVGIRDMSVLLNPPEDRYPVQTYVLEENKTIIQNAIERELSRGGQVYYVSNRVTGMEKVTAEISALVPDARVEMAHGQMSEAQLERTLMRFLNREIDVLVCTTIIETGMDVQNVNTIIIEDANHFGLAQLYQLRGRVGRTNRLAYAYLTFDAKKSLDEIAEKRLRAIKEFTEFGSGFKIAMRDLEIRGAGNVLGPEQHGFMASVGYDMYCQMLSDAVNEAMGVPVEEKKFTTQIELNINAYIPNDYINSEALRIEAYKSIVLIEDIQDYNRVQEELEDRFGTTPACVDRLMKIALLKYAANSVGITDISQTPDGVMLRFVKAKAPDITALSKISTSGVVKILYSSGERPYILIRLSKVNEDELIKKVNFVLNCLQNPQL
ncbi:MAG: transcription-repair coupling factor [Clostridia bacterium]|nr:transcription-repair coupling factor [Clostridia bacterium]